MKTWKDILIRPDTTVLDAMKVIEKESLQIALVADGEGRLLGTVTDGDVRRGILKGIALSDAVQVLMNPYPTSVGLDVSPPEVLKIMQSKNINRIPVLNQQGQVVGLRRMDELIQVPMAKENAVVIMAGGLGTRLGSLTENCPKPMLKVGNKPILEIILDNFIEHGFQRFYISVNYMAEMIEQYFGNGSKWGVDIIYIKENERRGTAGSLALLQPAPQQPVIVMNGDLLTAVNFSRLLENHDQSQSVGTMCVRQYDFQVPFGVVEVEGEAVRRIIEKPVHSFFVSAGVYVLSPAAIEKIPVSGKFDMPELFDRLIAEKAKTSVFPIHEYWLDIGRKDDFDKANIEINGFKKG